MKRSAFVLVVAALVCGGISAVQAQTQPAPSAAPSENVIVTAPKARPEKAIDNYIITYATPTPGLDKLARWKVGICPVIAGLPAKAADFIDKRVKRVAFLAGAPAVAEDRCRPNIAILFTPQPQVLLNFIRDRFPHLLGTHYTSQTERLTTMSHPIQAWYATATEDLNGFLQDDDLQRDFFSAPPGSTMPGARTMAWSGLHIRDGFRSDFTTVVIVVDSAKVGDQEIGALSDYIAMLALAATRTFDTCQNVPSITNLLSPDCDASLKVNALTDIDLAYLHGLYKMDADGKFLLQRGSIAWQMKKSLGGS